MGKKITDCVDCHNNCIGPDNSLTSIITGIVGACIVVASLLGVCLCRRCCKMTVPCHQSPEPYYDVVLNPTADASDVANIARNESYEGGINAAPNEAYNMREEEIYVAPNEAYNNNIMREEGIYPAPNEAYSIRYHRSQ